MDRHLEELVWERAHSRCKYCLMPREYDAIPFEIDHIIAVSHGGPTRAGNLALQAGLLLGLKVAHSAMCSFKPAIAVSVRSTRESYRACSCAIA
jgi:HNH endonuclease